MPADVLTAEELRQLCGQYEGTLRASYAEAGGLPAEWAAELAQTPADTAQGALRRYGLLRHYYLTRMQELKRADAEPADALEAMRQLLRREPVRVELAGRVVEVTGRSYAAMYEIAAHDAEIRSISADLDVCGRLAAAAEAELAEGPGWRRAATLRRRIRKLRRLHARLYRELRIQRRWLYAHALTPSGAPATSPDDAPEWVDEIDPQDDAALLAAVVEVGHRRYARLGDPPPRRRRSGEKASEEFGWATLFASIERQQKLPAGALYDVDLFQLRAWLRAGAPPDPLED